MEKNRSLDVITKLYKPFRITKINNVYVFNTMEGDYVLKENPKIDYKKLYNYLYSRSFNYVPSLSKDSRDDLVVFEYQEDIKVDDEQKIFDLINLVGLLHNKTSYYKDVTNDRYKEVYESIKDNLLYLNDKYEGLYENYINYEYYSPSVYLYLRNYSIIYGAIKYCLDKLDVWYSMIDDKNKERVVLVHNNLRLDHMIKNSDEYLISWDNYVFDTPVLDLYVLYKNEWENIGFKEVIDTYNNSFSLLEHEKVLLDILISIPLDIEFDKKEYERCRDIRRLINYLEKSSKIVFNG